METLDLTMQYDPEHVFPFVEDENGNITGSGHQDLAQFAAAVNEYDTLCNDGPFPPDEQWDADHIYHLWVTVDADGECVHPCDEDTPGAIPVTALWGQR